MTSWTNYETWRVNLDESSDGLANSYAMAFLNGVKGFTV